MLNSNPQIGDVIVSHGYYWKLACIRLDGFEVWMISDANGTVAGSNDHSKINSIVSTPGWHRRPENYHWNYALDPFDSWVRQVQNEHGRTSGDSE